MTLSCLRRPARADDRPPSSVREALLSVEADLLVEDARLVATSADTSYWVLPTRDGQGVCFFGAEGEGGGGGSGGTTTFEALRHRGAGATTGLHRGRWRYALLVADGFERARAGVVEVPVVDNFAVLDLPDAERLVELAGTAGSRTLDLGSSDWDDFAASPSR